VLMGRELGWDQCRIDEELSQTLSGFPAEKL